MKMRSAFKIILIFFVFAGIACNEIVLEQTFTIGKESTFRINQLYSSNDGVYTLLINKIVDSRCQEGVVCVWAGEVSIVGELTVNKVKSTFEIHSVLDGSNVMPSGLTIKLVDALPYPKINIESKPEDLLISLLIQKN